MEPGDHCFTPYECPFIPLCIKEETEYPVTCFPHLGQKAKELLEKGIKDIRDIPEDFPFTEIQRIVWEATCSGKPYISSELKEILKNLPYPRYYLDFETIHLAVPIWIGTRPYEQIPFQWSCHVEKSPGEIFHREFLEISGSDPRKAFLESLLEVLGNEGPIIVYGTFERSILKALSESFPEYKPQVEKIISRLVDLCSILRKYYYHPAMKGSWSLKKVLPTIAPEMDYSKLELVQDGATAQAAFATLLLDEIPAETRQAIIESLHVYCRMDTEALVRIVHFFTQNF